MSSYIYIFVNVCRVGDVLESINGINLTNADHRDAVRAVKETKRTLSVVSERQTLCISYCKLFFFNSRFCVAVETLIPSRWAQCQLLKLCLTFHPTLPWRWARWKNWNTHFMSPEKRVSFQNMKVKKRMAILVTASTCTLGHRQNIIPVFLKLHIIQTKPCVAATGKVFFL